MDSEFEDFSSEDDVIERPYGTKPYGTKPYGTKPYGTKPYGTKPYGTKPYGTKPYGTKPYGTKPYGTKPYPDEEALDPEVWSADVAELVCERSAVIRLGATIVAGDFKLQIPLVNATADYIDVKNPAAAPQQRVTGINLRPLDHQLSAVVAVPNRLIGGIAENAELADALKVDLADALTRSADTAFLRGPGGEVEPEGISKIVDPQPPGDDLLESARKILESLRKRTPPDERPVTFRNPGWILDPLALDDLTKLALPTPETLDIFSVLKSDRTDGGTLLGFPFVMSSAASAGEPRRLYFSADWQEAWVAINRELVTVDISTEARFDTNETEIRASMFHDFQLRRPEVFAWVEQKQRRRRRSTSGSRSRPEPKP
jgi:HK97 family phage major capsid protein